MHACILCTFLLILPQLSFISVPFPLVCFSCTPAFFFFFILFFLLATVAATVAQGDNRGALLLILLAFTGAAKVPGVHVHVKHI
jgi:hypothetical protein